MRLSDKLRKLEIISVWARSDRGKIVKEILVRQSQGVFDY